MFAVPPSPGNIWQNPPVIGEIAWDDSEGSDLGTHDRIEGPSRRTRSSTKTAPAVMDTSEEKLDLSNLTYSNWSQVDFELVPKVLGVVSGPSPAA
jgi:hypothetical protein